MGISHSCPAQVLEVVAADGLLGEDDASVRYMVDVAENVFAGADKARALTPVREDGAASYVERPAYWGEADEFADCGDPISTARVGMLYALFGDHLLAENLLEAACGGCPGTAGAASEADACALRDLVALRGALATRWVIHHAAKRNSIEHLKPPATQDSNPEQSTPAPPRDIRALLRPFSERVGARVVRQRFLQPHQFQRFVGRVRHEVDVGASIAPRP